MKKNEGLPLPIFILLAMAFSGMGLFCLYVIWQVVESIPPDFVMPWYINIFPVIPFSIAVIMLLWIKKYNKDILEDRKNL